MCRNIKNHITSILENFRKLLYKELSPLEIAYENNWYSSGLIIRYTNMVEVISRYFREREKAKFLDIGTAFGHFAYLLKKFYNCSVRCLDVKNIYSETVEDVLRKEDICLKLADLDKGIIPFDNSYFDFVIFAEVIEHLTVDPATTLKEINRVLKTNGYLLLTTPNLFSLENRIKLLIGKNISHIYNAQQNQHWIHHKIFSMYECMSMLGENNFNIVFQNYFNLKKSNLKLNFLFNSVTNFAIPMKDNIIILAKKK